MKTTIEIPDALLLEAKRLALRRRTTLRMLVLSGLRREVERAASTRGLGGIAAVGAGDWEGVDAEHYVDSQRGGWE